MKDSNEQPVVTEEEVLRMLAGLVHRLDRLAGAGEGPGVRPGEDAAGDAEGETGGGGSLRAGGRRKA